MIAAARRNLPMMNEEEKKHRFTAKIADAEPIVFHITLADEEVFRRAVYHVNRIYDKFKAQQPDKSDDYTLAKVALAFAELYYRKNDQLNAQSKMLDDFEAVLDEVLLTTDNQ